VLPIVLVFWWGPCYQSF